MIGGLKLIATTGKQMVQQGGVGALFYGLTPRLLYQVPSAMVGWYVIHSVQRLLAPYTVRGAEEAAARNSSGADEVARAPAVVLS